MSGTLSPLADLLADCEAHGIRLMPAGDNELTIDAPQEALTPELLGRLKAHKSDVLAAMAQGNIPEQDGSTAPRRERPFDDWVLRPDAGDRLGWEAPDLPEAERWWARATFDDLPEIPDARPLPPKERPCYWCGRRDWWQAKDAPDVVRCGWCHPPVPEVDTLRLNPKQIARAPLT